MLNAIEDKVKLEDITEIRVRKNCQLVVFTLNTPHFIINPVTKKNYIADDFDITYILDIASGHSVYAVTEQLIKGYLTYKGGIRIGVAGEGIYVGNTLKNIKNINSLAIRCPHEVFGCGDSVINKIFIDGQVYNTLIISPPSAGKTTLIRELARKISNGGKNTLIIDERNEIAGVTDGKPTLNIGRCSDVLTNISKNYAYQSVIRAMNPDLIVTDEIFEETEIAALERAASCGVNILATIHANGVEDLKRDARLKKLFNIFDYFVILDKAHIGNIKQLVRVDKYV